MNSSVLDLNEKNNDVLFTSELLDENLEKYFKEMFLNVEPKIVLDDDQIKAIMSDYNYTLVLAGAGTGKTTVMVGKVKYLVDIKKVNPKEILVISYTKKAVEELREIIIDTFNINANVTTFHSLAYKYVREIFSNRKCEIIDRNRKEEIFYDYINEMFKNGKIQDLIETFDEKNVKLSNFFYGKYFLDNYKRYNDYDTFFKKYKESKIIEAKNIGIEKVIDNWISKKQNSEYIITIKGELVKSVGECVIANFLFTHGIEYKYEKVYTELVDDRKIYKPDFTIELSNEEVYIEYFGLNDEKYNKITKRKIEYHKNHNNKFIPVYLDVPEEIENALDLKLRSLGFVYKEKSKEEILNQILDNNKLSQIFKLKNLFYSSINSIKESVNRENYLSIIMNYINTLSSERESFIKQFKYINDFYVYYSKRLINPEVLGFDYADLIYYSNKYIKDKKYLENSFYKYIIIDEYQDISDGEYTLAKETSKLFNSKVFAVGDDWQSIYSFRGSNIGYITKFSNYFDRPKIMSITNTYRNSQELIDTAGSFIRENKDQIDKDLISFNHNKRPIRFILYDDRINDEITDYTEEYKCLKKLILKIHENDKNKRILILARNNNMIEQCFEASDDFIDDIGTKVKIKNVDDILIDAMTIHKAKGLTYDEVIIIGMNKNFPQDLYNRYFINDLFRYKPQKESIPFAEERRIFYVALTRTKNNVYILTNRNPNNRSRFVDELIEKYKKVLSSV